MYTSIEELELIESQAIWGFSTTSAHAVDPLRWLYGIGSTAIVAGLILGVDYAVALGAIAIGRVLW